MPPKKNTEEEPTMADLFKLLKNQSEQLNTLTAKVGTISHIWATRISCCWPIIIAQIVFYNYFLQFSIYYFVIKNCLCVTGVTDFGFFVVVSAVPRATVSRCLPPAALTAI
jgi:hypothetical protein